MKADQKFPPIFDLTQTLDASCPPYPGDPAVAVDPVLTLEKDGCRVSRLTLSTHSGTHVDAPAHVMKTYWTLDEYVPQQFFGDAFVIDCRDYRGEIGPEVLDDYIEDAVFRCTWALFLTGWAKKMWKKPRYYTGSYPVPSMELLERLDALNILGIGFDSPGPDPYGELTRHHFWLRREGLIAENLDNLEGPNCFPRLCRFMIAPLKIAGSDAAPARAWAEIFPKDGVMVRKRGF